MRICIIYDCLFPHTVGGAERWYRNLAQRLSSEGHEVTYLTLRQWDTDTNPDFAGVKVVPVGPQLELYTGETRRFWPPIRFGAGVLKYLAKHGKEFDVVHTASFPYFSLLAAGMLRRPSRYQLSVDWHEVWTRPYWQSYIGRAKGTVGWLIQKVCIRFKQNAYCFSKLHSSHLVAEGYSGDVELLNGEFEGPLTAADPLPAQPYVMFAGRHIPEKRVPDLIRAFVEVNKVMPDLQCRIYGDGPQRPEIERLIEEHQLNGVVKTYGFVSSDTVEDALRSALCMVQPSEREGYGMVVVEAATKGTPSVVVQAPNNAATELISEGSNGFIARSHAPQDIASAIIKVAESGDVLRQSTADWYNKNATRLSLQNSLLQVLKNYQR